MTIFSGSELRAMSIEQESPKAQCSQLIAQSNINYDDSVSFYESQIRIADSLYKNYLPQSNFEEVKAAIEFFDSYQPSAISRQRWRLFDKEADDVNRLIAESRQLTAAKAHYYHAVGLTEKDDIVGACEHYLIALEIMEPLVETSPLWRLNIEDKTKTSPQWRLMANDKRQKTKEKTLCDSVTLRLCDSDEDYEKIRFVSLIYTRLGHLFYNENYCDIAISNYQKALHYTNVLENDFSIAQTLKNIGNSYLLLNNADSALCYYNKSLKTSSDIYNKLDVEKCIAQIMYFYKYEFDSAFMILKNNLNKIDNENVKYSYHYTLGNMYYNNKSYDSALYYLEESIDNNIITQKLAFATTLSAIYDSIGNYEKRVYYDNISNKLLKNNINKEVDKSKLQFLYNNYNTRKVENKSAVAKVRTRKFIIIIGLNVFVIVALLLMFIRRQHKKYSEKLVEEIDAKKKYIRDNEFKYSYIEGRIKSKNMELQKKEEQLRSQRIEIAELKSSLEKRKDSLKEFCQSEICIKILNDINELSKSGKDTSELQALRHEEFVMLLQSANLHIGTFLKNISQKYPSLKKDDLYYLCLTIINLNDKQIAALFGLSYDAIRKRRNKIISIFGISSKENLYKTIQDLL